MRVVGRALAANLGLGAAALVFGAAHVVVLGLAGVRASAGTGPAASRHAAALRRRASPLAPVNTLPAPPVVAFRRHPPGRGRAMRRRGMNR